MKESKEQVRKVKSLFASFFLLALLVVKLQATQVHLLIEEIIAGDR